MAVGRRKSLYPTLLMPPLLDWAAAHPVTAFMLACPAAVVLCVFSWAFANAITATWSMLCGTVQALAATAVIVFRGYPPAPPAPPEDDRPLAS